jgi:hypothetical protein
MAGTPPSETKEDVEEEVEEEVEENSYFIVQSASLDELQEQVNNKIILERYFVYHGLQFVRNEASASTDASPKTPTGMYIQVLVKLPHGFEKKIWKIIQESTVTVPTHEDRILALASDAIPLVLKALEISEEKTSP